MNVGEKIKELRESLGLSQEELAKKLGYTSRSSINKIELGKNGLPSSRIKDFATALNTTPEYIMGWSKEKSANEHTCLSHRLKLIMSERNLRQTDVINLTKPFFVQIGTSLNKNDLSQYLSGKVKPKEKKLSLLSLALGVSKAWLLGYDNDKYVIFSLSADECQMLESYRMLNADKRSLVLCLLRHLK